MPVPDRLHSAGDVGVLWERPLPRNSQIASCGNDVQYNPSADVLYWRRSGRRALWVSSVRLGELRLWTMLQSNELVWYDAATLCRPDLHASDQCPNNDNDVGTNDNNDDEPAVAINKAYFNSTIRKKQTNVDALCDAIQESASS
ncbi:unnamed protein product (mitochondrion) [Plasmodiophora brassicae]|uniref:Uncharacterized protein n=1 Tax=Plasmodiophora brassicae TaxID=37360 RepID=A0A3P3YHZ1_PLABS|nr:unnamed protein product [Plasmodiophora brassicae]